MKKVLVTATATAWVAGAGLAAWRALKAQQAQRADADLWAEATDTV